MVDRHLAIGRQQMVERQLANGRQQMVDYIYQKSVLVT